MKPTDFSIHVTSFLTHHLAAQRNLSPNCPASTTFSELTHHFCYPARPVAS